MTTKTFEPAALSPKINAVEIFQTFCTKTKNNFSRKTNFFLPEKWHSSMGNNFIGICLESDH